MPIRAALQTETPPTTEIPIPAGLHPDLDGAVLVCRWPTPRQQLDIHASPTKGLDGELELLNVMVVEFRREGEVVAWADMDPEQVPLPVFQFLSAACGAMLNHGVRHSGEGLRKWRKQLSQADRSTPDSQIS